MQAANAMIAHRYGTSTVPAASESAPISEREVKARRAALEMKQALDNSSVPYNLKKLSRSGTSTSYTFSFDLPLEAAIQQLATKAAQITARHGTGLSFLASFLETTPRAVLVISNDPVLAHIAYKTEHAPT